MLFGLVNITTFAIFGYPLFSDVFWKLLMLFDDMQIFPSRFEEENKIN
ncbi:hypothetical protein CLV32_4058 [Pedobacter duraquae]|uniref:Uncharacterized protein n=1 Tax=Pedobacter duraquae TaxID=425511 RepID=A0A4R6IF44_9SPHI|nr:hypothetical protein CLV32_4058 [Pedobacter duraquae]